MGGFQGDRRRAALAALLICTGAFFTGVGSAAAKFPAVRAAMTIVGKVSGVNREATQVRPQVYGCPAQTTELEERATVEWKATFDPVVVPLAKGPYLLYSPPHYRGGVSGGTYTLHDTYLRGSPNSFEEENPPCPTLASFSAGAELGQRPHPGPFWDNEAMPPAVVFGTGVLGGKGYGSISAKPAELAVPELEWSGDSSELVPVEVANALPLYQRAERPLATEALANGVIVNWKRLQPKLAALRHHGTVTLHVHEVLDNSKRPAPFQEQCFRTGAHPSCSESMDLDYTVKLRYVSPARGCDLATAEHCLL